MKRVNEGYMSPKAPSNLNVPLNLVLFILDSKIRSNSSRLEAAVEEKAGYNT